MKFLRLLEENNVTIGVHQKQLVNNWEYHSQIILWSIFHKTYAIECKEEAQLKTSWSDYAEDKDSTFAASVLKLSIEQKEKLLLWLLLLQVQNKISARNDQHSINIHNNIDGAIQLIYKEIGSSGSIFFKKTKKIKIALEIFYKIMKCVMANSRAFITVNLPSDIFISHIDNKLKHLFFLFFFLAKFLMADLV
jgi:hypothetical protein